ncbi:MAG: Rieske 2Fe-2S domain-containing protein [Magnetococcales bacterium]|nr:Rieske 2Fe-2S domain-containing protein [Magnetococcales bacterium]
MSKALNYLAKTRPEAAGALLTFYKQSVKALDDKTRHLIQIVTKVTVGTERGLRQYAPKALKAGASKEEILDAVLMAFPAAGLTKVLDAIDVLKEMELLPEVAEEAPPSAPSHDLGRLEEFPLGKMTPVRRPEGDLLLFRVSEEVVRVYNSRCPHASSNLCKGIDHGTRVECKVHNWLFDLATGECLSPEGGHGLSEIPARVENGRVVLA